MLRAYTLRKSSEYNRPQYNLYPVSSAKSVYAFELLCVYIVAEQ